ncbi:MBL fold metallo-hydrolase [Methanolapillus africanus]
MSIRYMSNPDLPIIKDGWEGNPMVGNSFVNEDKPSEMNMVEFMKWRLYKNPQKEEKKNDKFKAGFVKNESFAASEDDMIIWLGHASFFIRFGGVTFLTDPSYYSFPFRTRKVPIPCSVNRFKNVDYVIVSHMHHDHADVRSLRKIFKDNSKTEALVPLRGGMYMKHFTKKYQEAGWYQQYKTKPDVEVFFLPTLHWSRLHVFDSNKTLWGSFLIRANGKTIYFGGDTAWGNHFSEIAKLFPEIDYAIMPVGGYKPRSIMKVAHIAPDEAAQAAAIMNTKHFIPMHYGTYPIGQEPGGEPIREIKRMESEGVMTGCVNCLSVGEEFLIDSANGNRITFAACGEVARPAECGYDGVKEYWMGETSKHNALDIMTAEPAGVNIITAGVEKSPAVEHMPSHVDEMIAK